MSWPRGQRAGQSRTKNQHQERRGLASPKKISANGKYGEAQPFSGKLVCETIASPKVDAQCRNDPCRPVPAKIATEERRADAALPALRLARACRRLCRRLVTRMLCIPIVTC